MQFLSNHNKGNYESIQRPSTRSLHPLHSMTGESWSTTMVLVANLNTGTVIGHKQWTHNRINIPLQSRERRRVNIWRNRRNRNHITKRSLQSIRHICPTGGPLTLQNENRMIPTRMRDIRKLKERAKVIDTPLNDKDMVTIILRVDDGYRVSFPTSHIQHLTEPPNIIPFQSNICRKTLPSFSYAQNPHIFIVFIKKFKRFPFNNNRSLRHHAKSRRNRLHTCIYTKLHIFLYVWVYVSIWGMNIYNPSMCMLQFNDYSNMICKTMIHKKRHKLDLLVNNLVDTIYGKHLEENDVNLSL